MILASDVGSKSVMVGEHLSSGAGKASDAKVGLAVAGGRVLYDAGRASGVVLVRILLGAGEASDATNVSAMASRLMDNASDAKVKPNIAGGQVATGAGKASDAVDGHVLSSAGKASSAVDEPTMAGGLVDILDMAIN